MRQNVTAILESIPPTPPTEQKFWSPFLEGMVIGAGIIAAILMIKARRKRKPEETKLEEKEEKPSSGIY